jgi:uncharacterized protein
MRIAIWVRPGSARPGVGGEHDGALIVRVSARAVDGKATGAALAAVADSFGVCRSAVRLVSGASSRTKIVDIDAGDPRILAALLTAPSRLRPWQDGAAARPPIIIGLVARAELRVSAQLSAVDGVLHNRRLCVTGQTGMAGSRDKQIIPSGPRKPVRHEPVEAHVLFGSFADKATVDLCRDAHHEPA